MFSEIFPLSFIISTIFLCWKYSTSIEIISIRDFGLSLAILFLILALQIFVLYTLSIFILDPIIVTAYQTTIVGSESSIFLSTDTASPSSKTFIFAEKYTVQPRIPSLILSKVSILNTQSDML